MSSHKNGLPRTETDRPSGHKSSKAALIGAAVLIPSALTNTLSAEPNSGRPAAEVTVEAAAPIKKVEKAAAVIHPKRLEQLNNMATNGAILTLSEMIRAANYYGRSPSLTTNTPDGQSIELKDEVGIGMGAENAWYKVDASSNVLTVAYGTGSEPKDPNLSSASMTFTNPDHLAPKNLNPFYAQAFLSRNATRLSGMRTVTGDVVYEVSINPDGIAQVSHIGGNDVSGPNAPMDGRLNHEQLQADRKKIPDFIQEQITGQPSSNRY